VQPRLDHFFGYEVEKISTHDKAPALVLDGGSKFVLTDKRLGWNKDFKGQRFQSFEQLADDLTLHFEKGSQTVPLSKLEIYDPETDEVFNPFAVPEDELPPEPTDRIADEPTDEEVRREIASKEKVEDAE
jgi:hypothetical protein